MNIFYPVKKKSPSPSTKRVLRSNRVAHLRCHFFFRFWVKFPEIIQSYVLRLNVFVKKIFDKHQYVTFFERQFLKNTQIEISIWAFRYLFPDNSLVHFQVGIYIKSKIQLNWSQIYTLKLISIQMWSFNILT